MGLPQARRNLAAARRAGQTGPTLIWFTFFGSIVVFLLFFFGFVILSVTMAGSVFEPVYSGGTE